MAEFAIKNSVHASTMHTPAYVYGLHLAFLLIDCDSSMGERSHLSKKCYVSCSSLVDANVDTTDADVDLLDIDETRSAIPMTILLIQTTKKMMAYSASTMAILARAITSLKKRMKSEHYALGALKQTEPSERVTEEILLTQEAVVHFVQAFIKKALNQ